MKDNDIFVSYSRKDINLVKPLVEEMQEMGIRVWFDLNGIESGDEFDEKIISAINNSESLMFMYSENSIQGAWTKKEVQYAKGLGMTVRPVIIDGKMPKSGWFMFHYGNVDCIDITNHIQKQKLLDNLRSSFRERIEIFNLEKKRKKEEIEKMRIKAEEERIIQEELQKKLREIEINKKLAEIETKVEKPKYSDYEWPEDNTGWFVGLTYFGGRWRRREFGLVCAVIFIISLLVVGWWIGLIVAAAATKRCQDMNVPAYYAAVPGVSYAVYAIIAAFGTIEGVFSNILLAAVLLYLLSCGILCLYPGDKGINNYGSNPRRDYEEQCVESGLPRPSDCI